MFNNSDDFIEKSLENISHFDLDKLQLIFKNSTDENGKEIGLDEEKFYEVFYYLNDKNNVHTTTTTTTTTTIENQTLFNAICKNQNTNRITWNKFLDFIIDNKKFPFDVKLRLETIAVESIPHSKNETIAKIVIIENKKYFCYVIILKYGRVGLYDGNLNFLTSYQLIMSEKDLMRPEIERRRRNRWVTDALFCPDLYLFIITTSAKSIVIYEASGLVHTPCWLILTTPNIIECITYKPIDEFDRNTLFAGDSHGNILNFTFLQPKESLLKRKKNKDVTIIYWEELQKEMDYVLIKKYKKIHGNSVKNIEYIKNGNLLLSCSEDSVKSLIVKFLTKKRESIVYKMKKGVTCFALNTSQTILITGSKDGNIRLWNFLISKPIINLSNHQTSILDIKILENQNLFLSCSNDGILNLWDLEEFISIQTLKINFPSFYIHGKSIEWSKNCIYPGPKRNEKKRENEYDIENIGKYLERNSDFDRTGRGTVKIDSEEKTIWERSMILIACCNYIGKVRLHFNDASIEYSFTYPILPSPLLQNSVLIPFYWGLHGSNIDLKLKSYFEKNHGINVETHQKDLRFILDRNILKEQDKESNINYKIALLEIKKNQMKSKVSLDAPYLALDLNTIEEIKLSDTLPYPIKRKHKQIPEKIRNLLQDAANKDEIFSLSEFSGNTSKSHGAGSSSSSIGYSGY